MIIVTELFATYLNLLEKYEHKKDTIVDKLEDVCKKLGRLPKLSEENGLMRIVNQHIKDKHQYADELIKIKKLYGKKQVSILIRVKDFCKKHGRFPRWSDNKKLYSAIHTHIKSDFRYTKELLELKERYSRKSS